MRLSVVSLVSFCVVLSSGPARAQEGEGSGSSVSGRAAQVEEIVVSARRRAEFLEDTPVSVTALGEQALRDSTLTQMRDLSGFVPNLQFQAGGGNPNLAQVFIRGVGQVDAGQLSADPGVGVYVDGVYLARAQGSLLDVIDIAQLEVLRGPQGTLFGKNTAGGAINVTSIKPEPEISGSVMLRPGNLDRIDSRATINVPVDFGPFADKVFTRFTFASFRNGGFGLNELEGDYWSDRDTKAFQGAIRILPVDDLTIDIAGSFSSSDQRQFSGHCTPFRETPLQGLVPGFLEACRASSAGSPRRFRADIPGFAKLQSSGIWGTIDWDVGDLGPFENLGVKSITAYRRQKERFQRDMDMTELNLGSQVWTGDDVEVGEGFVLPSAPLRASQVSQELQLGGNAWEGRITFLTGLYYLADKATQATATGFIPANPTIGGVFFASQRLDNWSFAVFGQTTIDLTDWLSLTAGLRWSKESKEAFLFDTEPTRVRADALQERSFSAWTPMASVSLKLPDDLLPEAIDHLMAYFTYSKGFKSGGFNLRPLPEQVDQLEPYQPENLDSFEIGLKMIAFDRRLTFNTALFRSDYENIQVLTVTTVDTGGFVPTVVPLTQNAATAEVMGAEFELMVMPVEGLRITANGALLDTEYGEYDGVSDFTGDPINRKGETFSNVPTWSATAALQYTADVTPPGGPEWLRGTITPRVEGVWTGRIHFQGPELPTARQGSYGLLNLRLSYDFNDDQTQVALWGRNMTDKVYFSSSVPITAFGFNVPFFAAPRTFGAEITHRF